MSPPVGTVRLTSSRARNAVARAICAGSRRSEGPFLRVNCGATPPELVDSQLFGHERGSFTGASEARKGGSERVGGQAQRRVDVRIVAATHRDLARTVTEGLFRQDLWYRLSVFPIRIPPLRDRPGDIPPLAARFALRAAQRLGAPSLIPTPEDNRRLLTYSWPGNVRELAAVIERAVILGAGCRLEIAKALGMGEPFAEAHGGSATPPESVAYERPETLDQALARCVEKALLQCRGRIAGPDGAARLLGVHPNTLRARMKKLGVNWHRYRGGA